MKIDLFFINNFEKEYNFDCQVVSSILADFSMDTDQLLCVGVVPRGTHLLIYPMVCVDDVWLYYGKILF